MRVGVLILMAWAMLARPLAGQVSDIVRGHLPASAAVAQISAEAQQLWPMAGRFQASWAFATPKNEVARQLQTLLSSASAAARQAGANEDMQLLAGEVAAEAYNLDVKGAYNAATGALHRAAELAPRDFRPQWMLASFQCGTADGPKSAMQSLLGIESAAAPAQLSAGYWSDYLDCAAVTLMPEHGLRAADRLRQMHALHGPDKSLAGNLRQQVAAPDASRTYPRQAFWQVTGTPRAGWFYSRACGLAFRRGLPWKMQLPPLQNDVCEFVLYPAGTAGNTAPVERLVVIARAAPAGQTLAAFTAGFAHAAGGRPDAAAACPAAECRGLRAGPDRAGTTTFAITFQTTAPPYPGLRFETPHAPPEAGPGNTARFYVPAPRAGRIAPRMDYVILLEVPRNRGKAAVADLRKFVNSLSLDQAKP